MASSSTILERVIMETIISQNIIIALLNCGRPNIPFFNIFYYLFCNNTIYAIFVVDIVVVDFFFSNAGICIYIKVRSSICKDRFFFMLFQGLFESFQILEQLRTFREQHTKHKTQNTFIACTRHNDRQNLSCRYVYYVFIFLYAQKVVQAGIICGVEGESWLFYLHTYRYLYTTPYSIDRRCQVSCNA